jgi:hypothetical protein
MIAEIRDAYRLIRGRDWRAKAAGCGCLKLRRRDGGTSDFLAKSARIKEQSGKSATLPLMMPTGGTCTREAVDFALANGLSVGCSIHQQHTKKKDQIEHRKHE